jgi:hypothetical protein
LGNCQKRGLSSGIENNAIPFDPGAAQITESQCIPFRGDYDAGSTVEAAIGHGQSMCHRTNINAKAIPTVAREAGSKKNKDDFVAQFCQSLTPSVFIDVTLYFHFLIPNICTIHNYKCV